MLRFDLASIDGQAECSRTDAKQVSGFRQIHPSFRLAPITIVARDLMMRAKRRHSFPCPVSRPLRLSAFANRSSEQMGANARTASTISDDV